MTATLEERFHDFLDRLPGSERILPGRPEVEHGEKQADFLLYGKRIIAEIKTLKAPQSHKGEAVVDEYLDYAKVDVFGTVPLSRIVQHDEHLASLEKTIARRMTRGIENVCRSADKQIGAELSRLPHSAAGLLILINENQIDLHPRMVSDRVVDFASTRSSNIHYCLLVFESHLANIEGRLLPYPLLLDLTHSARQRRARLFLKGMQNDWAKLNGFPDGLPNPEPAEIDYRPDSIAFGH